MTIRISENIQDLVGLGSEYLVKGDTVIAEFYDGKLVNSIGLVVNDSERTV